MTSTPVRVERPVQCGSTSTWPSNFAREYTLERALDGIHRAGLTHVEIAAFKGYCEHLDLDTFDARRARQVLDLLELYELTPMTLSVSTDLT